MTSSRSRRSRTDGSRDLLVLPDRGRLGHVLPARGVRLRRRACCFRSSRARTRSGARSADDRTGLGRERGLARRGRRSDVRGVPGLVRDDVLGLLPRAPAHPRLPHRPCRLVRVAREERDAWLAGDVDLGEHDRQLRRVAAVGDRAVVPRSTAFRSTRTATSPATSWISSVRTACSPASPSSRCSRSTGRRSSRSARRESCAPAPRPSRARLAIPGAVLAAAYLVWTVVVAMDRNDKDLFPPALPAALGIVALALAVVFVLTGSYGRAFAMTGAGCDLARRHALREPVPPRHGLEHRLREQPDRRRRRLRRTTRSR